MHLLRLLTLALIASALPLPAQTIVTKTLDLGSGPGANTGQFTSQAVVNGNPAISYYDQTNGNLRYVRALDAAGTNWGTPITLDSTGDVGLEPKLVVVNGNPAISYYDATNRDLKYVRALDASGTSWGTPVALDSIPRVGHGNSLAVVNGNPAISYYDSLDGDLKYVRANTASGTLVSDWGAPVSLHSTGERVEYTSLAVINGHPAISYYESSDGELKYLRANTASGTLASDWGTPVTLDSTGNVGLKPSLVLVNGNPAISYYDSLNADLKYVRANTPSGTLASDWGTPVTLDSFDNVGFDASLAVVHGNPAISYSNNSNSDLKYVRAITASGMLASDWGTPVTLDSTGQVGRYTSLVLVNGNPAISYYDTTNANLKWATFVSLPSPEITIEQPSGAATDFANGGSKALGNISPNSSVDLVFTIKNYGNAALNLSGAPNIVAVSGSGDFTVIVQPVSPVASPNGSTSFTVRFSPTSPGLKTATFTIPNNDPDEGTFTLNFTGSNTLNPTFSGYTLKGKKNTPVSVGSAKLLARAADTDGGTPAISGVGALSAQGGSLVLGASSVEYSPPVDFTGLDTFGLTIIDGQGGSVVGTVTVNVGEGNAAGSGNEPQITLQPGGSVALLFQAIPGQSYRVERSTDLQAWTLLETVTAASDGTLPCVDPDPPAGSAFYRLVVP